ncbi:unnamed protein product, partial [Ectocarpus sp. 12 AP-2014]
RKTIRRLLLRAYPHLGRFVPSTTLVPVVPIWLHQKPCRSLLSADKFQTRQGKSKENAESKPGCRRPPLQPQPPFRQEPKASAPSLKWLPRLQSESKQMCRLCRSKTSREHHTVYKKSRRTINLFVINSQVLAPSTTSAR